MSSQYYYLVASLPGLEFDKKPPISREAFLSECGKWMSEKDFAALAAADIKDFAPHASGSGMAAEWKTFDGAFRTEIAASRRPSKETGRARTSGAVQEVFTAATPLDAEKVFEKNRWYFLESRDTVYHFDVNTLIAYYLKLQICERLAGFDREKGEKVFAGLCEVKYD